MKKVYDKGILIPAVILCVWGLFMVFNTTRNLALGHRYMLNQILATVLGVISFAVILRLPVNFFKKLSVPIYIISVFLLIWVLYSGTGFAEWGARSWIRFNNFGFQPAEITKIGFIIFYAAFLSRFHKKINELWVMCLAIFLMAVPLSLIMLQPDFGTAMVYLFIFTMMLLGSGIDKRYIAAAITLFTIIAPVIWLNFDNYQKDRIYAFLDSSYDLEASGFQVFISKEAITTSGLWGKGILRDGSEKFLDVPENHTDFVFTAITESFGIIGGAAVIILFLFIIYRISKNGSLQTDGFKKFALFGFSAMMFSHFFENIAMTMGAVPMTGIPLPFMSYGGTFQLTNIILIALCYKFSAREISYTVKKAERQKRKAVIN